MEGNELWDQTPEPEVAYEYCPLTSTYKKTNSDYQRGTVSFGCKL